METLNTLLMCCVLMCASAWINPAHAKRVALIIGNAQYQNEKPLKNPVNDAHALARILIEDLQFDDVIERSNVTRRELGRLIDQLGQRAQGADAVMVYYSGHGMQGAGGNYLIPVDAQITSTEDVKLEGVPANDVVDVLNQSGARVALLILDACRDNPFRTRTKGGSKGLARMNVSGGNLLVAYATQEGDTADDGTGSNSPYAQALIQNLKRKDLRVLEVFDEVAQQVKASTAQKQRPTRYGDLPVNVFLTGAPASMARAVPLSAPPEVNTGGVDFSAIERVRNTETEIQQRWAAWQGRMKSDFDKAMVYNGSAQLESQVWQAFLQAYQQDNPFSTEDDQMRQWAERKRDAVLAQLKPAQPAPSSTQIAAELSCNLSWIWPTNGPLVSTFGAASKGISIGGNRGEPVFAAAAGRVVYAGSGLRGYGNLIIIRHNANCLTSYSHSDALHVKEDDQVQTGQKIADLGSTESDRVQLSFEIWEHGKPVDPLTLLPTR